MSICQYPEETVRVRSYLIWEREGRQRGRDKEYWGRAEAELEAECRAALEGRTLRYVPPHLKISAAPVRTEIVVPMRGVSVDPGRRNLAHGRSGRAAIARNRM